MIVVFNHYLLLIGLIGTNELLDVPEGRVQWIWLREESIRVMAGYIWELNVVFEQVLIESGRRKLLWGWHGLSWLLGNLLLSFDLSKLFLVHLSELRLKSFLHFYLLLFRPHLQFRSVNFRGFVRPLSHERVLRLGLWRGTCSNWSHRLTLREFKILGHHSLFLFIKLIVVGHIPPFILVLVLNLWVIGILGVCLKARGIVIRVRIAYEIFCGASKVCSTLHALGALISRFIYHFKYWRSFIPPKRQFLSHSIRRWLRQIMGFR